MTISDVLLEGGFAFKTYLENGREGGSNLKILVGTSFMNGP